MLVPDNSQSNFRVVVFRRPGQPCAREVQVRDACRDLKQRPVAYVVDQARVYTGQARVVPQEVSESAYYAVHGGALFGQGGQGDRCGIEARSPSCEVS